MKIVITHEELRKLVENYLNEKLRLVVNPECVNFITVKDRHPVPVTVEYDQDYESVW